MKQDIDNRHGERIVRKDGSIKFYNEIYSHPILIDWVNYPVIVKGYGYDAIDVYLIERKLNKWGKGKFLCMISGSGVNGSMRDFQSFGPGSNPGGRSNKGI